MSTVVFAKNYRGFKEIEIPISSTVFLVGDNSSGKSSILHLINYIIKSELVGVPTLDDALGVGMYDFFSPYFEFDDVTIGFSKSENDVTTSRLIEFRISKSGKPNVTTALYAIDGLAFTLKKRGSTWFARLSRSEAKFIFSDLKSIFEDDTGFSKITFRLPENQVNSVINAYMALHSLAKGQGLKDSELSEFGARAFFAPILGNVVHTTPLRAQPEKYYNFVPRYKPTGAHFASMWKSIRPKNRQVFHAAISQFGKESGLFESVDVQPVSRRISDSPLTVIVRRNGRDFFLTQVGVGVSQIVPLLVGCMFASFDSPPPLMLLQQPELHLHPVAQAAAGEFLFEMAKKHVNCVIETHSDFLIDRFRARIRETKDTIPILPKIIYCFSDRRGNNAHQIDIAKDGSLVDPPASYSEFFLNEVVRTMF